MINKKIKFLIIFLLFITICDMRYAICKLYAQDNSKLVALTKQIMEAKGSEELWSYFAEAADLYFSENKYNEFVEFLNSLGKQKKAPERLLNYHIALSRYHQLKHLEETQSWDEYFSQGNNYREQLAQSAQKAVETSVPTEALNIYARLLLWKFHQDQQDASSESALSDLLHSTFTYAKDAKNFTPIKDAAAELSAYGKKSKAKELSGVYVDKLITSKIKDEALAATALGFYQEGNLDLAQALYDAYIERILKSYPKEKSLPLLRDIAQLFSYQEGMVKDALYAEKLFKKLRDLGGKEVFDEELMYLRAINLEKVKEYQSAKDGYQELLQSFPQTRHSDEADFKLGIIYTYILSDVKTGKTYFEKLSQKETLSPQAISGLYQLGLLSQWEGDLIKAKDYYHQLIEKAGDGFLETLTLTKERLKELAEERPIEYGLKTFLDVSLKEEYAMLDMSKLDLSSHPYTAKKDGSINVNSTAYTTETGCLQLAVQYLWSGHLGTANPKPDEPAFNTAYTQDGTKEINLVVVSPTGIIDRNLNLIDID